MVEKVLLFVQSYLKKYLTDLIPKGEIGYNIRNRNIPFFIADLKVFKIHFSLRLRKLGIV